MHFLVLTEQYETVDLAREISLMLNKMALVLGVGQELSEALSEILWSSKKKKAIEKNLLPAK